MSSDNNQEKKNTSDDLDKDKFIIDFSLYMDKRYCYNVKVNEVYDADTITVDIDLGFFLKLNDQKIRLFGINAPEMRGSEKKEGTVSRDQLRNWILGKTITLYSVLDPRIKKRKHDRTNDNDDLDDFEVEDIKKGKYGRWLGIAVANGEIINKKLVDMGLAKYKLY